MAGPFFSLPPGVEELIDSVRRDMERNKVKMPPLSTDYAFGDSGLQPDLNFGQAPFSRRTR